MQCRSEIKKFSNCLSGETMLNFLVVMREKGARIDINQAIFILFEPLQTLKRPPTDQLIIA